MLPTALTNLYNTKHVFEVRSHTYYNCGDFESFTCTGVFPINDSTISDNDDTPEGSSSDLKPGLKRLVRGPKLTTPSKPYDGEKQEKVRCQFIV